MHHVIRNIAEARFLDQEKFSNFASTNEIMAEFGITGFPEPVVSSWHLDGLVKAFKNTQSEQQLRTDRILSYERQKKTQIGLNNEKPST